MAKMRKLQGTMCCESPDHPGFGVCVVVLPLTGAAISGVSAAVRMAEVQGGAPKTYCGKRVFVRASGGARLEHVADALRNVCFTVLETTQQCDDADATLQEAVREVVKYYDGAVRDFLTGDVFIVRPSDDTRKGFHVCVGRVVDASDEVKPSECAPDVADRFRDLFGKGFPGSGSSSNN